MVIILQMVARYQCALHFFGRQSVSLSNVKLNGYMVDSTAALNLHNIKSFTPE